MKALFSNNNKISINVFLNTHCKNAINWSEFVKDIQVSLEDLTYTTKHGYVEGISNIFVKHLIELKPTERPLHCSDQKRLNFFVKDQDTWEKDKNNTKIDKSIQDITFKQIQQVREWQKKHPDFLNDEDLTLKWHYMIRDIMGGATDIQKEKNIRNILKKLSNKFLVKDAMI